MADEPPVNRQPAISLFGGAEMWEPATTLFGGLDPFATAAARTYQAVKPGGGRKESDVTRLPEEVTSKLATNLMEAPFRAASAPMRALTGKLQVNDPETGMPTREAIGEAQGVAGMIMGGSTQGPKGAIGTGPPLKPPERISFQSSGAKRGETRAAAPRQAPIVETPEAAAARKAEMQAEFDKLMGGGKETPKPTLDPSAGRIGFASTGTKKGPTLGAGEKKTGAVLGQFAQQRQGPATSLFGARPAAGPPAPPPPPPPPPPVHPPDASPPTGGGSLKQTVTEVSDDLNRLRQSAVADRAEVGNKLTAMPPEVRDPALGERLYHAMEDPAEFVRLTPQEQQIARQHLEPMQQELTQLYERAQELRGQEAPGVENYVHRMAKGHTPQYDIPGAGAENPIAGTRSLNQTTSAMQQRKYLKLTGSDGKTYVAQQPAEGQIDLWQGKSKSTARSADPLEPGGNVEIAGKHFNVSQATTKEIEANTPTEYYKNAFVNTADAVVHMRQVVRNLEYLDQTKQAPWFLSHAIEATQGAKIPLGWKATTLPQLEGWSMDPKLAHVFDDFHRPGIPMDLESLRALNRFTTASMFWNPTPHIENVAAHWFTGRGWDWARPGPMRDFMRNMARATKEVVTQGPEYQRLLREGSGLVSSGVQNADFYRAMAQKFGMEVEKNPTLWRSLAAKLHVSKPAELIAAYYNGVNKVLWQANDMFMLQRVFELEGKGLSAREAIKEAEKHIPNYRIPPEVMKSRAMSQILQDPAVTMFSRYHYGMLNSYANLAKDMYAAGPQRTEAFGNLAALAVLGGVLYPLMDYGLQKLHGDDKAQKLRRGSMTPPTMIKDLFNGDMQLPQAIGNILTLAPVGKEALQQGFSKDDWFTGKPIAPAGNTPKGVVERTEHAAGIVQPYQMLKGMSGGGEDAGDYSAARQFVNQLIGEKNMSPRAQRGKAYGQKMQQRQEKSRTKRPGGPIEKGYNWMRGE